jgi:hypothetical protein
VVFADNPMADEVARAADRGHSARQTCPGLQTQAGNGDYDTQIVRDSAPAGSRWIERNGATVGCYDDRYCLFPCASADEAGDPAWLHRLYLKMANHWRLPGATPADEAGSIFRSDTGELVLDQKQRVFTVVAPNVVMAAGFLATAGELSLGKVTLRCKTAYASVSLVSLDGKPLEQSERLLLTAVGQADNTDEVLTALGGKDRKGSQTVDADTGALLRSGQFALTKPGRPPVRVEPVDAQLRLATSIKLHAYPLDSRGARQQPLATAAERDTIEINTRAAHSPWVLVTRD